MPEQSYSVRHVKTAYSGFMTLDLYEATIELNGHATEMVREVHDHGHGACVLPFDPERRTCLLVRQLRLPVHVVEGNGLILEAAAGLIDKDDASPAAAAQREAAEELRYLVRNVAPVGTVYPIPGMVTELMHCFVAEYAAADRITEGFAADEDEVIEVEEWGLDDLWRAWKDGRLRDGKAVMCLMGLKLDRPELFTV
ncbi:NUDIX domain-containing protein [Acuticoccus sp. I52.16.1]|uniref:NUDIX domain-containing protein n=1 Tax=Acuticoccus sp. I52.16.1 TaxID=2928472 RepID=UPI001FD45056|nr:NUDIX domain-containing protein [Acuticoccus sp. I52.16.1]UOM36257.1 NUDIX domain-containing protein [Acuticoccus sp. I52.16.1]